MLTCTSGFSSYTIEFSIFELFLNASSIETSHDCFSPQCIVADLSFALRINLRMPPVLDTDCNATASSSKLPIVTKSSSLSLYCTLEMLQANLLDNVSRKFGKVVAAEIPKRLHSQPRTA